MHNKILRHTFFLFLIVLVASGHSLKAQVFPSFGDARSGTAGFQFTKIVVDPRSASMGSSTMADAFDASSLYWNPALAVQIGQSEVMISHTAYVVETNLEYISVVNQFNNFALGASLQYFSSGDITETTTFEPTGTGRTFGTRHISAGLSVSHRLTDLFSYGLTLRYIHEGIEEITIETGAIDFGFFYRVGETGLRFAVGINNFGLDGSSSGTTEVETLEGLEEREPADDDPLPTRFNIAAAFDLIQTENSSVVITGQITNPSDNAERFSLGAEYGFLNKFFVRTGYEFGVEERVLPSFGGGVQVPFSNRQLAIDYAYTSYNRLGDIHRLAVRIPF